MRKEKYEEEIPKSVLKMKQEKEKREKLKKGRAKSTNQNIKNTKKEKGKHKKSIIKKIILVLIFILLITVGMYLGVSAHRWKEISTAMFTNKNSVVLDKSGEVIAEIGNEQKKITAKMDKIPENLKEAYVSIEDERFYSHYGIDIKRTGGAILSYITSFGNSSYGGSTITQQLVKNLTGDTEDSIIRKVNEWWKAFLLERYFTKEEILELYLNVIYVGPNVYGVQTGAKYYFNKDVEDLSLAECAFLAGINNSPNYYNPFEDYDNEDDIKDRTLTVLQKMLELGKIDNNEFEKAKKEVNSGLKFEEGSIEIGDCIYTYHTDALINEVIEDLAKEKNISQECAQNYLYLSGSTIYSTQDSSMQEKTEEESLKQQYILYSTNGEDTSQGAMVILNHQTGEVLACIGGLGEKETFRGLNRATQSQRQTGSSIKPLAVLVPGISENIFTGSTIYNDKKATFEGGYSPGNNDGYLGKITVRRALESSQNVPFVEMMEQITPQKAISYLEKMGISSLTEKDNNLALALGGLDNGITPLEMAAAYATIANDGIYIEPTFYSSIVDNNGKTVLKSKQEKRTIFSEQIAYVIKKLLQQPVEGASGTATYCQLPGIDVAAKTGTTDENYDKWLCGFTPYYTAVTWFGFDQNETIYYNNQNPAGIMWANVMKSIHDGFSGARFYMPNKISMEEICSDTGEIARTGCNDTYIEYFISGTEPNQCQKHSGKKLDANITKEDEEEIVYVDDNKDLELTSDDEEDTETNISNEKDNENDQSEETNIIEDSNEDEENVFQENDIVEENDILNSLEGNEDNTVLNNEAGNIENIESNTLL